MSGSDVLNHIIEKYRQSQLMVCEERVIRPTIARKYGVTTRTMLNWSRGETQVAYNDLKAIVEMLGYDWLDIMNEVYGNDH